MNLRKITVTIAAAFLIAGPCKPAHSQSAPIPGTPSTPTPWHSDHVVYVAGLADLKPDISGSLTVTANAVDFESKGVHGSIPLDRITVVSTGDERVATGGAGGKVARAIPFFGFGAVVGAVTNKKVDLLTIEYRDQDGGYHGAVFEVPKTQAAIAQQQLSSFMAAPPVAESQTCRGVAAPNAILVAPIALSEVDLPAEYRVLLYEQLVGQLRESNGGGMVYRAGDAAAPCGAKTLQLSVTAFKKGNEAVRASTGPVGLFVGGTSVTFHVSLTDTSGTLLFEKSLRANKRGDGDSLGVTRTLAKTVTRRLAKAQQNHKENAS